MDIETHLRGLLVARDPGPSFTEAVMAQISDPGSGLPAGVAWISAGKRRRLMGVGLLVAAAAAALTVVFGSRQQVERVEVQIRALPDVRADDPVGEAPAANVDEASASASSGARDGAPRPAARIHLYVMPAAYSGDDPAARAAIDVFRRQLMLELERTEDLVVHDGERENPSGRDAGRVIITALGGEPDPGLRGEMAADDALAASRRQHGAAAFRVNMGLVYSGVERMAEARVTFAVAQSGSPSGEACAGGSVRAGKNFNQPGAVAFLQTVMDGKCANVAVFASALGAYARSWSDQPATAPARPESTAAIRLPGGADGPDERSRALWQLAVDRAEGRRGELDDADVASIVEISAALPVTERLQAWRRLGNLEDAALQAGYMRVLESDPDERVRLEMIVLLEPRSADPLVRAAIERAATADSVEVVRMAAARVLDEQSNWMDLIHAALRDETLPFGERLSAVMLAVRTGTNPARRARVRAVLEDEALLVPLLQLVSANLTDPLIEENRVVAFLGQSTQPQSMEFFARLLRDPRLADRMQLQVDALHGLLAHKQDEGVRRQLREIAVAHPQRFIRDQIQIGLASN